MKRVILIFILILLAGTNVLFDFLRHASITQVSFFVLFSIVAAGIATGTPAALALFISSRTKFKIAGVNIYRVASDIVLFIGLFAWFYLVVVRDRPEYYEGASHLYVVTWPVLLGLIAVFLYIVCILVQGITWVIKHNKALYQRP